MKSETRQPDSQTVPPAEEMMTSTGRKQASSICQRTFVRTFTIVVLSLVGTNMAQAQTFSVLHNFNTSWQPPGTLVRDTAGNLYGVYADTVFKLDTAGNITVLSVFSPVSGFGGLRGSGVNPDLVVDAAGNLYGTTPQGGLVHCFIDSAGRIIDVGCGMVFKLDPAGQKTVLYNFNGPNLGNDGAFPNSRLVRDSASNIYGTTSGGGANDCSRPGIAMGCGTIFKLDTSGNETVLNNIAATGLVMDTAGNLYGIRGESIYKLDKIGAFTVLYAFTGGTDGYDPRGALAIDGSGNLYGTTYTGGLSSCMTGGTVGCGVVFKVDPGGKETVLYSFTGGSSDGANPKGGVVLDAAGNIYGTTSQGGAANVGTVFKLDTTGTETVLHNFTSGTDGGNPSPGLVLDPAGNLYGSGKSSGNLSCGSGGWDVIFKIAPATPDFSLSSSTFSPNTISPGKSSTSTLSITGVAGFSSSITLSCSVQPSPVQAPQCSISPSSVTPGTPATLTVTTTAPTRAFHSGTGSELFYALWLPLMGFVAVRACGGRPKRTLASILLGCVLVTGLIFETACGGGSTRRNTGGGSLGTPAGTYTVTIAGADSSGSLQHSTTTTITVQ
jgi:uncharacterized repeat protein (TIGR03803 family)